MGYFPASHVWESDGIGYGQWWKVALEFCAPYFSIKATYMRLSSELTRMHKLILACIFGQVSPSLAVQLTWIFGFKSPFLFAAIDAPSYIMLYLGGHIISANITHYFPPAVPKNSCGVHPLTDWWFMSQLGSCATMVFASLVDMSILSCHRWMVPVAGWYQPIQQKTGAGHHYYSTDFLS